MWVYMLMLKKNDLLTNAHAFLNMFLLFQQRKEKKRERGTNQQNILKKETEVTGKKGNKNGFDYCPNRFFYYVGYILPLIYQYAILIFLIPTFL